VNGSRWNTYHKHHVTDRDFPIGVVKLLQDLAPAQIALDAHGPRGAERTSHLTPNLRRDAQSLVTSGGKVVHDCMGTFFFSFRGLTLLFLNAYIAAIVPDNHGLDTLPILQLDQQLDRTIHRHVPFHHF